MSGATLVVLRSKTKPNELRPVFGSVFGLFSALGLPAGVLAQLALLDSNGNAHMLGTLLAPHGVVAIPPEIFGPLLPYFMQPVPGVIFVGDPPFSLWEPPPPLGRIPPHRSDAGCYL